MTLTDELQIARAITGAARCALKRGQQAAFKAKEELDKLQYEWERAVLLEASLESRCLEQSKCLLKTN
jgi:hypothetical protein